MKQKYKTPSRRRLNKWRTRVEKLAFSNIDRRGFAHWFAELLRCQPMIESAKRKGVDLLDRVPRPSVPLDAAETRRMLCRIIFGHTLSDWPTRKNLEI